MVSRAPSKASSQPVSVRADRATEAIRPPSRVLCHPELVGSSEAVQLHYVGVDLAWGERARTGLALLDPSGVLVRSSSVRTDEEIEEFLGPQSSQPGLVAAIDAPLIVPNESGQRNCETEISRMFGRFHAGAHTSNRSRPAFVPEPRGARLARRFGWHMDPAIEPGESRSVCIEVYPHPAMVSLFNLDRVIPYKGKSGRDLASRRAAMWVLFDHMVRVCGERLGLATSVRWAQLRDAVAQASRKSELDRIEDEVDAILCAYLAWMWANERDELLVVGDVQHGYIVTPRPPTLVFEHG